MVENIYEEVKDLSKIRNSAIQAAMSDGYNHVVIEDKDGNGYSHNREYNGCCPEWYGKIIERVVTWWEFGILKYRIEKC